MTSGRGAGRAPPAGTVARPWIVALLALALLSGLAAAGRAAAADVSSSGASSSSPRSGPARAHAACPGHAQRRPAPLGPAHDRPRLVTTASHGCVRVTQYDARWLFDFVSVGTPVRVIASSR
jgi:hypothetical protein